MASWCRLPGRSVVAGVLCFSIVGCSGADFETVPVSGVVTLDGNPMADILVSFQPKGGVAEDSTLGPGSFGITDENGRFQLNTADASGAPPGEQTVTLVYKDSTLDPKKRDPSGKEEQQELKLPPKARDGSLTFTVPEGGTDQANFDFQSSKPEAAHETRRPPYRF